MKIIVISGKAGAGKDTLGEIIGEAVDEDLVDTIFKEFCMGK